MQAFLVIVVCVAYVCVNDVILSRCNISCYIGKQCWFLLSCCVMWCFSVKLWFNCVDVTLCCFVCAYVSKLHVLCIAVVIFCKVVIIVVDEAVCCNCLFVYDAYC